MFIILWLTLIFISLLIMVKSKNSTIHEIFKESVEIGKGMRLSHFLMSIPLIVIIATVGTILYNLHPILQFGWLWSMVNNVGVEVSEPTFPFVSLILGSLLLVLCLFIPKFAHNEEISYRKPYLDKGWGQGIKGSLIFGLMHMVMGIPLSFALALSIGGFAFLYVAKKKGIMESTYFHSAYNMTIMVTVIIIFWSDVVMYLM